MIDYLRELHSVSPWAPTVLAIGVSFIIVSISAFIVILTEKMKS